MKLCHRLRCCSIQVFGCEKGDSYRHIKAVNLNRTMWFDSTLSDECSLQTMAASRRGLRRIDNSEFSRTSKAWMFQHGGVSVLVVHLWSMPSQLIIKLLIRWLGLSLKAFPKIGLYHRKTPKTYQTTRTVGESIHARNMRL